MVLIRHVNNRGRGGRKVCNIQLQLENLIVDLDFFLKTKLVNLIF